MKCNGSEAALLDDVFDAERSPRKQTWDDRLLRLLRWPGVTESGPTAPSLGSCATMIFFGAVEEGRISDRAATYLPQLIQRPPIQQAMQGKVRQDAVRRLVVAWVVECPNHSDLVVQQRLGLGADA